MSKKKAASPGTPGGRRAKIFAVLLTILILGMALAPFLICNKEKDPYQELENFKERQAPVIDLRQADTPQTLPASPSKGHKKVRKQPTVQTATAPNKPAEKTGKHAQAPKVQIDPAPPVCAEVQNAPDTELVKPDEETTQAYRYEEKIY